MKVKVILAVAVVILLGAVGYVYLKQPRVSPATPGGNGTVNNNTTVVTSTLLSFGVVKPNIVVRGSNLSKIEIWGIPTGTGMTEEYYNHIGDAKMTSKEGGVEIWAFAIPKEEILISAIFARGFDANGKQVGEIMFPYTGPADIEYALHGGVLNIDAFIGKNASVPGITITPLEVLEDSRCPANVMCVWAGRVRLRATLSSGLGTAPQIFTTNEPITTEAEKITLVDVRPTRLTNKNITPADYVFEFEIRSLTPPLGEKTNRLACPMDAKLCPDGSAVGRTGPNCEFAACP